MTTTTPAPQTPSDLAQHTASDGGTGGCCDVYVVDADRVRRAQDQMLPGELADELAAIFKVLSHPTRVRILRAVASQELCVCDIAHVLGMSISAVSHQLRNLRHLKIVRTRAEGKLVYYRLSDPFVTAILTDGVRHVAGAVALER